MSDTAPSPPSSPGFSAQSFTSTTNDATDLDFIGTQDTAINIEDGASDNIEAITSTQQTPAQDGTYSVQSFDIQWAKLVYTKGGAKVLFE